MKQKIFIVALLSALGAEAAVVKSPDGRLALSIDAPGGIPTYSISYDGKTILADSPLGFVSDVGDFSSGMTMGQVETDSVHRQFTQDKIKKRSIDWRATRLRAPFTNSAGGQMTVEMEIADNDVALRYLIPRQGETAAMVIKHETTGFHFPESSTAFITPQADAMTGWKRTKPSYEEYYVTDAPLDSASQYGNGYTFPALFRIGNDGWALLSETGVDGYFCGSHLSDYTDGGYSIAYAMPGENNGNGSASPGVALPCATPWRTITVGSDLAPIVETVVPWAVVEPRYTLDRPAMAGRGSWSWLLWQDNSINFDDQVKFIDLAAEMGYENVLIDNFWDKNIGRERMPELFAYARAKGINPILWYS
ncbi:MAG: glycoside hydrolase family 97 N-terminal domain-containing protein, partial [Muribaculaceae bacterium]|nr:glycoside hydrolase family 97 N-terminal domain-containing protein [Muribaculaceae bacterium]